MKKVFRDKIKEYIKSLLKFLKSIWLFYLVIGLLLPIWLVFYKTNSLSYFTLDVKIVITVFYLLVSVLTFAVLRVFNAIKANTLYVMSLKNSAEVLNKTLNNSTKGIIEANKHLATSVKNFTSVINSLHDNDN